MIRAAREIPTNFSLVNVTVSPCLTVSTFLVTFGLGVPVTVAVLAAGAGSWTTVARPMVGCPFCPIVTVSLSVTVTVLTGPCTAGAVTRTGTVTVLVTDPLMTFVTVCVTVLTAPGTVTVAAGGVSRTVINFGTSTVTGGSVTHVTPGTQIA